MQCRAAFAFVARIAAHRRDGSLLLFINRSLFFVSLNARGVIKLKGPHARLTSYEQRTIDSLPVSPFVSPCFPTMSRFELYNLCDTKTLLKQCGATVLFARLNPLSPLPCLKHCLMLSRCCSVREKLHLLRPPRKLYVDGR